MEIVVNPNSIELPPKMLAASRTYGIGDHSMMAFIVREKIYKNPLKAAIQEYLCNARDANREAQRPGEPVIVEMPDIELGTSDLTIADRGNGISRFRMTQVFVQYCVSTKRSSDDQTGGFGLGCKTGFAYGDSFTVESVWDQHGTVLVSGQDNDGEPIVIEEGYTDADLKTIRQQKLVPNIAVTPQRVKDTWLHFIGAKGDSGYTLLSSCVVDESTPTGSVIKLPMRDDVEDVVAMVAGIAKYWDPKPLCNVPIEWPHRDANVVFESETDAINRWVLYKIERNTDRTPIYRAPEFVIDGVPYEVDIAPFRDCSRAATSMLNSGIVLFFKNGEVMVTASREDIDYKPASIVKIAAILERVNAEIEAQATARCTTKTEIFKFGYESGMDGVFSFFPKLANPSVESPYKLSEWTFSNESSVRVNTINLAEATVIVLRDTGTKTLARMNGLRQRLAAEGKSVRSCYIIGHETKASLKTEDLDGLHPAIMTVPELLKMSDLVPLDPAEDPAVANKPARIKYEGTCRIGSGYEFDTESCAKAYRDSDLEQISEVAGHYKGAVLIEYTKGEMTDPWTRKTFKPRELYRSSREGHFIMAAPSRIEQLKVAGIYASPEAVMKKTAERAARRIVVAPHIYEYSEDHKKTPAWIAPLLRHKLFQQIPGYMEVAKNPAYNRLLRATLAKNKVLTIQQDRNVKMEYKTDQMYQMFPVIRHIRNSDDKIVRGYLDLKLDNMPITIEQLESVLMGKGF